MINHYEHLTVTSTSQPLIYYFQSDILRATGDFETSCRF